MRIKGRDLSSLFWQAAVCLALLGFWQWAATVRPLPYLPPLQRVAAGYVKLLSGELLSETVLASLFRLLSGLGIAILLGIALGIVIGSMRAVDAYLRPLLEYLRFLPAVAILPAALLIFGATDTMRILVIAFGSVFPVLLASIDGARRVESLLIDVARISGLSMAERLFHVVLPAALPSIFAGIRVALSIGLVMMVISELVAADDGLGFYILRNQRLFQTANVYAGVLLIGTMGLVFTLILLALERRILVWHRGWRGLSDNTVTG